MARWIGGDSNFVRPTLAIFVILVVFVHLKKQNPDQYGRALTQVPGTSVGNLHRSSDERQILRTDLAAHFVGLRLDANLLAFAESVETSTLYRADVNENVSAISVWLNEAEALLFVKPLHSTCNSPRARVLVVPRDLRIVLVRHRDRWKRRDELVTHQFLIDDVAFRNGRLVARSDAVGATSPPRDQGTGARKML